MEIDTILRELEWFSGPFPETAVRAAAERREEIAPELLRVLEDTLDRAKERGDADSYMAHFYAMFLLAQFRDTRAYPLVLRLARLDGDLLDALLGDFLTESLHGVLASVCGGELGGIKALIEDPEVSEWSRVAGLGALVTLVAVGQKSREEILEYFGYLFHGGLEREPSTVWDFLVDYCTDLHPGPLMADIEWAFDEDLVDPAHIDLAFIRSHVARGPEHLLAELQQDSHHQLIEDTVAEMDWWACFHEDETEEAEEPLAEEPFLAKPILSPTSELDPEPNSHFEPIETFVRDAPKIGRNEPCPCGSGKKYKKCCGSGTV